MTDDDPMKPMRWYRSRPGLIGRLKVGGPSSGKEKAQRYATDPEYRASLVTGKAWEKAKRK
jgi:hypothetical protein